MSLDINLRNWTLALICYNQVFWIKFSWRRERGTNFLDFVEDMPPNLPPPHNDQVSLSDALPNYRPLHIVILFLPRLGENEREDSLIMNC